MSERDRRVEEQILVDGDVPEEYEREIRGLADIARDPPAAPLAAVGAVLVLAAIGYQALAAAVDHHPAVGALVVAAGAVAYLIARRFWAVQHRHVVRELAKEGELDRLRE